MLQNGKYQHAAEKALDIAVIQFLPHIANFTDFNALRLSQMCACAMFRKLCSLGSTGSDYSARQQKYLGRFTVVASQGWLPRYWRTTSTSGTGAGYLCGYQMLKRIIDGVESGLEQMDGLGLLMETQFAQDKETTRGSVAIRPDAGCGEQQIEGFKSIWVHPCLGGSQAFRTIDIA